MNTLDTSPERGKEELSLVQQAAWLLPRGSLPGPDEPVPAEIAPLPDGYVRRSPPQPYRTPEGYFRRIAQKAALYALAAVLLLLLVLALFKRGILRF